MLLEDARIGEIAFNPVDRSLIGVRHALGFAVLVRVPYPYTDWQALYTFPYESVPYDLDISADGKLLSASMSEVSADQFLRVWELDNVQKGEMKPLSEFRFGQSIPESFVFTPDGKYLYGSSYYTGVSNIFRYEVATGKIDAVSNAESGFFRPVPIADGKLVVLTYTGEGFVPAIIDPKPIEDVSAIKFLGAELVEKFPVLKTWQVSPPSTIDVDKEIIAKGPYAPLRNIALDNAFPIVTGYKDSIGIGYHLTSPIRSDLPTWASQLRTRRTATFPAATRPRKHQGRLPGWRGSSTGIAPISTTSSARPRKARRATQPRWLRLAGDLRLIRASSRSKFRLRPTYDQIDHITGRAER
jgi:hypothetical protein